MRIATWTTFRYIFAPKGLDTNTFTFTAAGKRVAKAKVTPDFATLGFKVGQKLDVYGSALNDGRYTITNVDSDMLVHYIVIAEDFSDEGAVDCDLLGVYRDNNQIEEFPGPWGHDNLVRAHGFLGSLITGYSVPGHVHVWTCNGFATDAVPGVDEYNWYLSQRTDDPLKQYLLFTGATEPMSPDPRTYSGSVTIHDNSPTATADLGFTGPSDIKAHQIKALYNQATLYCQRVSDGAIQLIDLARWAHNL